LFYAAIDTRSHTMAWTSAGHPCALLQNLETNEVRPIGADTDAGLPLGIYSGVEYTSFRLQLPPASRILVYSDGLTDALQHEGAEQGAFGIPGVMETLRKCRDESVDLTLEKLFLASSAFTGGMGRHDDTSVVLVERQES
jgi:serine phosphatase RsbU (regulator of sigma subunit)